MRYVVSSLHILLLSSLSYAFDCKQIKADSVTWNFEKLGGLHQVSWVRPHVNLVYNTTFKIDICKPLELENKDEKKECGHGTRICSVEYHYDGDKEAEYVGSWPITRDYFYDGLYMDPKFTRMKTKDGADKDKPIEGVIAELGGGRVDEHDQKTIIDFTCISDEGKESRSTIDMQEDDKKDDKKDENDSEKEKWKAAGRAEDGAGGRIEFVSYDKVVLRLNWFSPYACEKAASNPPEKDKDPVSGGSGGGWGFFSWFFFLIFMLLVLFVVFTAWVNYNRNGARGWDLLPFSDTLRDLPYILGDWSRKIASTLGGSGTRGGYSAV